jgi:hypothetical protein
MPNKKEIPTRNPYSEARNPYSEAHSKRGGAGAGSHRNKPLEEKRVPRKRKHKKKPSPED